MAELKEPLQLFTRAFGFSEKTAIVDGEGSYTYSHLLSASAAVAGELLNDERDLSGKRVAFLVESSFEYVAVLWGIWRAGGIAVPLCTRHPSAELEYIIDDSGAEIIVACRDYKSKLSPIAKERGLRLVNSWDAVSASLGSLPVLVGSRDAMIIYTSGTTSRPKGALLTHANLEAQITSLVKAWEWSEKDNILNVLPMHHVHGIVNVLSCGLWSGACVEMMPSFDADAVWDRFRERDLSLFMAVPTMYAKLIENWDDREKKDRNELKKACKRFRLFVSGSAALPAPLFEKWRDVSGGRRILERYGMTEIGMALSNPFKGDRRPGTVGIPLPEVEVKLVDKDGKTVEEKEEPGEIYVRGPGVFKEYWNRPEATAKAFTEDGWFRTGDLAVVDDGYYRILGRMNVDIIKTGGFKVSALEVEQVLLEHNSISEVAVVGVPDETWGERVAAAIVEKPDADITPGWLRGWAKQYLADYKVPTLLLKLNSLPRNTMGKVNKPRLVELFLEEQAMK